MLMRIHLHQLIPAAMALHAAVVPAADSAAAPARRPASLCNVQLPALERPEPMSKALQRLAQAQPFKLEYWTSADPMVRLTAGRPTEWIADLAQRGNVMVRYARHRSCPGQWRIDTVWVLPAGSGSTAPSARRAPAPPDAATQAFMRAHAIGNAGPAGASQ